MTPTQRIDDGLKRESEVILDDLGLSMSGAINLFLRQVVKQRAIPFAITCDSTPAMALSQTSGGLGARAIAAMERLRAERIARGEREWTMYEIDAGIDAARKERRKRAEAGA